MNIKLTSPQGTSDATSCSVTMRKCWSEYHIHSNLLKVRASGRREREGGREREREGGERGGERERGREEVREREGVREGERGRGRGRSIGRPLICILVMGY